MAWPGPVQRGGSGQIYVRYAVFESLEGWLYLGLHAEAHPPLPLLPPPPLPFLSRPVSPSHSLMEFCGVQTRTQVSMEQG